MPKTVNAAFKAFLSDSVNLDPTDTQSARTSRTWLANQIAGFDGATDFPALWGDIDINFGSFERRTKKRPLDDIDMMIGLTGQGSTYNELLLGEITITVGENADGLKSLRHDGSDLLNSRKVVNAFIRKLKGIPQYSRSDIKRSGEAATLNLTSYAWAFDIVPCFKTAEDWLGRTYYLIPDGNGHWKKTDPRLDRARVTRVNRQHDGHVLNVIRIMKFWNRRATMPSMGSYLIENMILDYYEFQAAGKAGEFVDLEIPRVLEYINRNIHSVVNDPKNIQGDLNTLSWDEREKIKGRSYDDYYKAQEARQHEDNGDHEKSIKKWGELLGPEFPNYG